MDGNLFKSALVFGDSIMYGSGNNGFGVGEFLQRDFNVTLKKYAVGGARVGYVSGKNWLVEQVRSAVKNGDKADIIIFDGFTNDCFKTDGINCDVPLGEIPALPKDLFNINEKDGFSECFSSVAAAFKKYFAGSVAVFVRPHKMGRREKLIQKVYGERAVEICRLHGVLVADIYSDGGLDTFNADERDKYTCDSYGWGHGDCTHPNKLGYELKYLPIIYKTLKITPKG